MIETARTILRRVTEADFDSLWAIWANPRVQTGLLNRPQTTSDFRLLFDTLLASETMWAVEDRATGAVIGRCGLFEFVPERQAEVAYLLDPTFWGRGLATEIARAAVTYAFEERGWPRAFAFVLPNNAASIAVLKKIGFVYESDAEVRGQTAALYAREKART